jgi:tetratricopeptide (TPR) repeat protein
LIVPLLALTPLLCVLAACQSDHASRLNQVYKDYEADRFAEAFDNAKRVEAAASGPVAVEAAYMAGVSGVRLKRDAEAEPYLVKATRSADGRMAGEAHAELGLIHLRRDNHARAADAFESAAERLDGQDKANAYYYAGVARQQIGQNARARVNLTLARGHSTDPAFTQRINEQLNVTGYTIQLGAFQDAANATRLANEVAPQAAAAQLGAPRLVPSPQKGLTLVQVGQFSTVATAEAAKRRLGRSDAIVVVMKGP